jgi:hypothetical protein
MFQSINVKTVLIESFDLPTSSVVQSSEVSHEQEMKKQNLGMVVMVGGEVDWPKVGMTVKYLRNAATNITDDETGTEYQVVNKAHVLAELKTIKGK